MACEAALSAVKDIYVVRTGTERTFLSNLSIEHLPVARDVRERLHLLGLNRLGQIGAFTLSALTSQFGATGKALWEIANGIEEQDRIPCAFSIADIDESIICDEPVYSRDQIKIALLTLLEKLCLELEDLGKACRAIKLVLDLQNKSFIEKQFFLSPPTAHKDDMLRRIMVGLEQVELPSPVQIMSVRASSLVNNSGKQENLFQLRSSLPRSMADISGMLKTKYGSIPVGHVIENNTNTLLPDDRYVFVDP
jgi:protein ImuB